MGILVGSNRRKRQANIKQWFDELRSAAAAGNVCCHERATALRPGFRDRTMAPLHHSIHCTAKPTVFAHQNLSRPRMDSAFWSLCSRSKIRGRRPHCDRQNVRKLLICSAYAGKGQRIGNRGVLNYSARLSATVLISLCRQFSLSLLRCSGQLMGVASPRASSRDNPTSGLANFCCECFCSKGCEGATFDPRVSLTTSHPSSAATFSAKALLHKECEQCLCCLPSNVGVDNGQCRL